MIILRKHQVGVLILDSIAAVFRAEYSGRDNAIEKALKLFKFAQQFKIISDEFKIPILVVNHVYLVNCIKLTI